MASVSMHDFPNNICEDFVAGFCFDADQCMKEHLDVNLEHEKQTDVAPENSNVPPRRSGENRSIREDTEGESLSPVGHAPSKHGKGPADSVLTDPGSPQVASQPHLATVCEDFVAGFCAAGEECTKEHRDMNFESENTVTSPSPDDHDPSAQTAVQHQVGKEASGSKVCNSKFSSGNTNCSEKAKISKPVHSEKTTDQPQITTNSHRPVCSTEPNKSCGLGHPRRVARIAQPHSRANERNESVRDTEAGRGSHFSKSAAAEGQTGEDMGVDKLNVGRQNSKIRACQEASDLYKFKSTRTEGSIRDGMDIDNTGVGPLNECVAVPECSKSLNEPYPSDTECLHLEAMETDDIMQQPCERSVSPTPPEPSRPVSDAKRRPTVLRERMTLSHWKVLRDMAFQGSAFDRLAFKIVQELFVSPTVGIGLDHLPQLNKALENVPYLLPTGELIADWIDFEDVLPAYEDTEASPRRRQSAMSVATKLFGNNLSYYFGRRSRDEYGAFGPRTKETIPARGVIPSARIYYQMSEDQNDRVADDPLFQEIEQLLYKK